MSSTSRQSVYRARAFPLIIALLFVATGCQTFDFLTSDGRIQHYIRKYPDRPAPIKEALLKYELTRDMRPAEVRLCWGSPGTIEDYEEDGAARQVWRYFEDRRSVNARHSSALFDYAVPLGSAVFDKTSQGLTLVEWIVYLHHLKHDYPYLFSLALRTNPLDANASVVVR